jgi:chromosomal replication initiation ATPase DnaA
MPIPVTKLIAESVDIFNVSSRDITEPGRFPHIYQARAAVILAARKSGRKYAEIGRAVGGRDGATIKHACRRASDMCERDPAFRASVEQLTAIAHEWAMANTQAMI